MNRVQYMKKSHKIWLLILTIIPVVIIPVFVIWVIFSAINMESLDNPEVGVPLFVGGIMIWGILIALLSLIAWVYFLVHVINNETIEQNEKLIWILLFIFVGLVPQLVYFFMRVWPLPEPNE